MRKRTCTPADRRELMDFNAVYSRLSNDSKKMALVYLSALRDKEIADNIAPEPDDE